MNTMKYDELTLMQFADGELDEGLTAEIENARLYKVLKVRQLQNFTTIVFIRFAVPTGFKSL